MPGVLLAPSSEGAALAGAIASNLARSDERMRSRTEDCSGVGGGSVVEAGSERVEWPGVTISVQRLRSEGGASGVEGANTDEELGGASSVSPARCISSSIALTSRIAAACRSLRSIRAPGMYGVRSGLDAERSLPLLRPLPPRSFTT